MYIKYIILNIIIIIIIYKIKFIFRKKPSQKKQSKLN